MMKKSEKWNFQGKGVLWASTTVDTPALGLGSAKWCGEKGKEEGVSEVRGVRGFSRGWRCPRFVFEGCNFCS